MRELAATLSLFIFPVLAFGCGVLYGRDRRPTFEPAFYDRLARRVVWWQYSATIMAMLLFAVVCSAWVKK